MIVQKQKNITTSNKIYSDFGGFGFQMAHLELNSFRIPAKKDSETVFSVLCLIQGCL